MTTAALKTMDVKDKRIVRYHITDDTIILGERHSQILNYISGRYVKTDIMADLKRIIAYFVWGKESKGDELRTSDLYSTVHELFFKIVPSHRLERIMLEKTQRVYGLGCIKVYDDEKLTLPEQDIVAMLSYIIVEQYAERIDGKHFSVDIECNDYTLFYYYHKENSEILPLSDNIDVEINRQFIDSRKNIDKQVQISLHGTFYSMKDPWYQNKRSEIFKVRDCLFRGDFHDIEGVTDYNPNNYYKVIEGEYRDSLIHKFDASSHFNK